MLYVSHIEKNKWRKNFLKLSHSSFFQYIEKKSVNPHTVQTHVHGSTVCTFDVFEVKF